MNRRQLPNLSVAPPAAAPPIVSQESLHPGLSMMQILCVLRAYWKQSLIMTAAVMAVMYVVIKLMPKSYVATATLMVNYENKDPLAGRDFPTNLTNTYIPTQIELMMSPVILLPVVDKLKLTSDPEFVRGFQGSALALQESVQNNLRQMLQIQQGKGSQLLYIGVSSKSGYQAAQIANAVADEYLSQERQRTNEPAGERATRYSEQLAELRAKVTAAQDKVTEFRQRNGITDVNTANADIEVQALNDLEQKLLDAQNQRRAVESKQSGNHSVSDEVMTSAPVQGLKAQLSAQEAQMAELRATMGPQHPKILELQSQIAATRKSLAAEIQSISENTDSQLDRARELEAKFQRAVGDQRTKVLALRKLQDDAGKLLLELESAQATYKRALDGYDQIMFASAGNYTDVSFISRATPPAKADKPDKMKYMLMSTFAGLCLGLAAPFGYELLLNRRLRCRDDLERDFGIPVLAQFEPIPATPGLA